MSILEVSPHDVRRFLRGDYSVTRLGDIVHQVKASMTSVWPSRFPHPSDDDVEEFVRSASKKERIVVCANFVRRRRHAKAVAYPFRYGSGR